MSSKTHRDIEVAGAYARRISPICFILLTSCRSFAAEQSLATKAWTILEAGVQDKSLDRRVEALSALGLLRGNKKAVGITEHALHDAKPDVRRAAVIALGEMNSRASLPGIKALIKDSDAKTVVAIAAVLKKFNDPEGYEIYYQILTGKRKGGGQLLDGIKDKRSLEKMGVETAIGFVPFGGVGTGAYDYFQKNGASNSNVDVTAATALADDPDPEGEKALVQASFGGKEVVQVAALRALAKRGDSAVVTKIEPAMYSDKALIRYTAAATVLHSRISDQSSGLDDELGNENGAFKSRGLPRRSVVIGKGPLADVLANQRGA